MKAIEIGGVEDHVHILLSLPSTMTVSKALQLIKGGSSKWVHETFPEHQLFAWQEEYGAFSVSVSQLDKTIAYIKGQEAHHRKMTFQEEFLALLKKHRIEYDERVYCGNEIQPSSVAERRMTIARHFNAGLNP